MKPEEKATALRKMGSLLGESDYDWIEVDFGIWFDKNREEALFNDIKKAVIEKRVICSPRRLPIFRRAVAFSSGFTASNAFKADKISAFSPSVITALLS